MKNNVNIDFMILQFKCEKSYIKFCKWVKIEKIYKNVIKTSLYDIIIVAKYNKFIAYLVIAI